MMSFDAEICAVASCRNEMWLINHNAEKYTFHLKSGFNSDSALNAAF